MMLSFTIATETAPLQSGRFTCALRSHCVSRIRLLFVAN